MSLADELFFSTVAPSAPLILEVEQALMGVAIQMAEATPRVAMRMEVAAVLRGATEKEEVNLLFPLEALKVLLVSRRKDTGV